MNEIKIKEILVGMLEPGENGKSEFEQLLDETEDGRERNNIKYDMDGAKFLVQHGIAKTDIFGVIIDLRSTTVMKKILFSLL